MVTRADFDIILVRQTFNQANVTSEFNFRIEPSAASIGDDRGYGIMQVRGVGEPGTHSIEINGREVQGNFDFQPAPGASQAWLTWMFTFGVEEVDLHVGINTFRITRQGNDDFAVGDVVIHWRERE